MCPVVLSRCFLRQSFEGQGIHLLVRVVLYVSGLRFLRVEPRRRMRRLVDLLKHADRNVRVDLCRVEPYMTQHQRVAGAGGD